jgi:hypothetical protein
MSISYAQAILAINSNAEVHVIDDDYNQITWLNISVIDKATLDAKKIELQTAEDDEASNWEANKTSGNQKLLDLGLTQAEIKAVIGFSP